MPDISGLQVAGGAFGVASVSALLMLLVERMKDYLPGIHGRAAMAMVDALSLGVTLIVLYQVGVNWHDGSTYVAVFMGTLSLGIITRGHYAAAYHVAVAGSPMSSAAGATVIADPAPDTGGIVTTITPQEGQQP